MANPDLASQGNLESSRRHGKIDILFGYMVFLIALPFCLGISLASGFPPIAGIFTTIIGGMLTPFLSNAELTIKGLAAGLIVVTLGAVQDLGHEAAMLGYKRALAVGVIAGFMQIAFGVTLHANEPLQLLAEIPNSLLNLNPEIALIGGLSVLLLLARPYVRLSWLRAIPGPIPFLLPAMPLAACFDISHAHLNFWSGHEYTIGPQHFVHVPESLFGAMNFPDFSSILSPIGWKWLLMFTVIGGLPINGEIVRSLANYNYGVTTRWVNFFHGSFHLVPVAAVPASLITTLATDLLIGITADWSCQYHALTLSGLDRQQPISQHLEAARILRTA